MQSVVDVEESDFGKRFTEVITPTEIDSKSSTPLLRASSCQHWRTHR
jgi:hypothetical protein